MPDRKVRLTIRPDEDVIVGDAEYRTLRASGLLAKTAKTDDKQVAHGATGEASTASSVAVDKEKK